MKIALVGYGKMGHMIETVAKSLGHEVVATVDVAAKDATNVVAVGDGKAVAEAVKKSGAEGIIEFSHPTAVLGNLHALIPLGIPVVCGTTGWAKSESEIEQLLESEAESHSAEVQFKIGECYYNGTGGASKDLAKAAEYFEKACWQRHANAQVKLGSMYEKGTGVEKDIAKAKAYYKMALGNGVMSAKIALEKIEKEENASLDKSEEPMKETVSSQPVENDSKGNAILKTHAESIQNSEQYQKSQPHMIKKKPNMKIIIVAIAAVCILAVSIPLGLSAQKAAKIKAFKAEYKLIIGEKESIVQSWSQTYKKEYAKGVSDALFQAISNVTVATMDELEAYINYYKGLKSLNAEEYYDYLSNRIESDSSYCHTYLDGLFEIEKDLGIDLNAVGIFHRLYRLDDEWREFKNK